MTINVKYKVFYQKSLSVRFLPKGLEKENYRLVAEVNAVNLEDLFRKMNIVNGTELPVRLKIRSMSVGDVAVVGNEAWYCDLVGWMPIHFK